MREFRRKQKIFKRIMNVVVIATAVLLFVLIAIEPTLYEKTSHTFAMAMHYAGEIMVVVSLVLVMYYYSKYSKSDVFLTNVEYELSDCGYYLTERSEKTVDDYYKAVRNTVAENGFVVTEELELSELDFAMRGVKRNEAFYTVNISELDKNDVIAHLDSVVYDITVGLMKRSGNVVLLFVCDTADYGAVSLSKTITTMGRKDRLKIAVAIAEVSTGRTYFLGNNPTKCQQMIAEYVLGTPVPIKDELKGERLPYQDELEKHMKNFDLSEYRKGNFFSH